MIKTASARNGLSEERTKRSVRFLRFVGEDKLNSVNSWFSWFKPFIILAFSHAKRLARRDEEVRRLRIPFCDALVVRLLRKRMARQSAFQSNLTRMGQALSGDRWGSTDQHESNS